MHETKNIVIAVILSTVILLFWQVFYVAPRVEEARKQQEIARQEIAAREAVGSKATPEKTDTTQTLVSRDQAIKDGGRIKINSPRLHGSISLQGARFDDLTLAGYKVANIENSPEVALLSPKNTKEMYFAEFGWMGLNNTIVPDANTVWSSTDRELGVGKPVTLTWDNNHGQKFDIKIAIDENYLFTITRSVKNYGNNSISVLPYGILNRTKDLSGEHFAILHEGALGVLDGVLTEEQYKNLKEDKKVEFKNSTGWIGITDKYWLTAMVPTKGDSFDTNFTYFSRGGQDRFQVDYLGQRHDITAGESLELQSNFFAGAKEYRLLNSYAESSNIPFFDRAVDFGLLYFITKPLFKLLTYYHNLLSNFGLAILLLTVTVKLIMFPLANKSYRSMNQLKIMQPRVKEIHERYKDDKLKANKAIMELYKSENVNPMSGCMPLLVQIPVFFALYKVLFVTIEMRHAPFFGWISDLSAPDPTTLFNLFGLIDWTPPAILHIGAWPIIMAITMYLQQLMNPAPTDPVQAKVMKFLPLIFLFMFAAFPAGLVIYWAWNNILSILQQWMIMRKLK